MHQPRPLAGAVAERAEHAVDMLVGAGAALHREPHRLVEHHHVVVFVERDRLEEGAILLVLRRVGAGLRRIELERRNADRLAALEPVLGLRALAVHAHLAFADDALDVGERQPREPRLEEAVEPHAVLVAGDGDGLHAARLAAGGRSRGYRPTSGGGFLSALASYFGSSPLGHSFASARCNTKLLNIRVFFAVGRLGPQFGPQTEHRAA